ncbi:MAG: chemotaxis protein methyltransferase CheR [Chlamydiales bacterium]|jgi:chemotaxis protein methyltransferase CheR
MNLTAGEFDAIRKFVHHEAGIVLDPGKEYLVESRMAPVLRSEGVESLRELVELLKNGASNIADKVIDAMTTNETSFFRDGSPFEVLKDRVLPRLIDRNRANKSLTIWCAASSSGQEPISLSIMLKEHFPELLAWDMKILATDICEKMLSRCRGGLYSKHEVSRGLPEELRSRYFEEAKNHWKLRPSIQNMVEYKQLNLTRTFPVMPPPDLVMIRNVLIYFDEPTKLRILKRIRGCMRPDGYLMLGTAEVSRSDCFEPMEDRDCVSFYRPI